MSLRAAAPLLLLACAPARFEECPQLRDATAVEECRFAFASPLVADPPALSAALATVPEAQSRDLLLLRLAIAHPTRAPALCAQVETPSAREKCQQVIGRPHLQSGPRRAPAPP